MTVGNRRWVVNVAVISFNNTPREIERFLRGFARAARRLEADGHAVRLVSIDNGRPIEWAPVGFDHIVCPPLGNLGFARAANRIVNYIKDYRDEQLVILANPDGMFHGDCMKRLVDRYNSEEKVIIEARQFPEEHPKYYDPISGETAWCSGACLLFSVNDFLKIGGFDERYFLYMEDVDFSWRARMLGYRPIVESTAIYMHDVVDRGASAAARREMLLSHRSFAAKWGNKRTLEAVENEILRARLVSELDPISLDSFEGQGRFGRQDWLNGGMGAFRW